MKNTIEEILEEFEYDASIEAYNNSPMVNLLKEREKTFIFSKYIIE